MLDLQSPLITILLDLHMPKKLLYSDANLIKQYIIKPINDIKNYSPYKKNPQIHKGSFKEKWRYIGDNNIFIIIFMLIW